MMMMIIYRGLSLNLLLVPSQAIVFHSDLGSWILALGSWSSQRHNYILAAHNWNWSGEQSTRGTRLETIFGPACNYVRSALLLLWLWLLRALFRGYGSAGILAWGIQISTTSQLSGGQARTGVAVGAAAAAGFLVAAVCGLSFSVCFSVNRF